MMAVDLHNTESLLFPSHQPFNEENNTNNKNILSVNISTSSKKSWSSCFSNSSDFGSAFSSPVESELGSTESDSDQEDDYIAELTRQMAHYMLQDDEDNKHEEKQVCSQEEEPITEKFENLKINEEKVDYANNGESSLGTSVEPSSVSLSMKKPKSPNLEFQSRQALIDYQIKAIQLYKLKQDQIMKQQQYWGKKGNGYKQVELSKHQIRQIHQNKVEACNGFVNGPKVSSWANLQQKQRTGSEMTAVFLGEPGSRSGSCGTGVFLPRGTSNTCQSRKKQGCSTVLIPARVVQALKLQFDRMGIESRSNGAPYPFHLQNDGLMEDVRYNLQVKKNNQSKNVQPMNNNNIQEIGLPQEWTY